MVGGRAPRGVEATHREAVLERQGAYRDWVRSILQRPQLLPGPDAAHTTLGRENLALLLLSRNHPEDRTEATDLLRLALRDADAMGIPEATTIRNIQRDHNLT